MAKKYDIYFAPLTVSVEISDTSNPLNEDTSKFVKGTLQVGVRLEKTLLDDKKLYKKLRLKKQSELESSNNRASQKQLQSYSEGASIGAFRSVSFSLIPVNPDLKDKIYGDLYNTYICFSATLTDSEVADILYDMEFESLTEGALYKVLGGSIKERRSRKFKPVIS